ncbi:SlyX family protein [Jannaschia pohangensis]|uniref:SlyX protein n=1 Tax=Jannaschia pohangensis TaxID=390807 RepID=A0A1I3NL65_9RHOB|nr:SlyX family protein [Jannaschia pohangensis]SFJ09690.1 SlyX protein [Jannaschia pohangensis]
MQDIEERIAHLTRAVEDLSDVVARQSGEIATLERRVRLLMERSAEAELAQENSVPLADQRPPHW